MYVSAVVSRVTFVCQDVARYVLELERPLLSAPGQFVMLWIPGVGEIPLSVALEERGRVHFIVARKGRVTSYLHRNIGEGERLFVRGPLGRSFKVRRGKALIVGGGVGIAPLVYLSKVLRELGAHITAAVGFKSAEQARLAADMLNYAEEVHLATEDGSAGVEGTAVDLAVRLIGGSSYDVVYTCGREQMMRQVVELALSRGLYVEASLERLIKCGIGICGSCTLEPLGLRVCSEGPVFDGAVLVQTEDFGRWWRDAAGRKVPL